MSLPENVYASAKVKGEPVLAMGVYDSPQAQDQPVFYLNHYLGNTIVYGSPMTGKTTFIKTFLVRIHKDTAHFAPFSKEEIYIIDFGGNLGDYSPLKNVCACFNDSNEENVKRIFKTLESRLKENIEALHQKNYYEYVKEAPDQCPPHMTLIVENVNAFLSDERYATYLDRLMKFCRDGLSKGLSVILTANDTSGTAKLAANCGQKIAFEMPADTYFEIFNTKINRPIKIPGRGIVNIGSFTYELQCFLPFANEKTGLEELIKIQNGDKNPKALVAFPAILTKENIADYCADKIDAVENSDSILVGLDYYDHSPICVNIKENRAIAVYGKRPLGMVNLLSLLLAEIREKRADARFVFCDDGRKDLQKYHQYMKEKAKRDSEYKTSIAEISNYVKRNGYFFAKDVGVPIGQTPFTVFVLQGRYFYQESTEERVLMGMIFSDMVNNAVARDYLFIFWDVRVIPDVHTRSAFNNMMSAAFLLDNIGDFVADKGRGNNSVFGEMDARQLKAEYAECASGDGYFYDISKTDTPNKIKIIEGNERRWE